MKIVCYRKLYNDNYGPTYALYDEDKKEVIVYGDESTIDYFLEGCSFIDSSLPPVEYKVIDEDDKIYKKIFSI